MRAQDIAGHNPRAEGQGSRKGTPRFCPLSFPINTHIMHNFHFYFAQTITSTKNVKGNDKFDKKYYENKDMKYNYNNKYNKYNKDINNDTL